MLDGFLFSLKVSVFEGITVYNIAKLPPNHKSIPIPPSPAEHYGASAPRPRRNLATPGSLRLQAEVCGPPLHPLLVPPRLTVLETGRRATSRSLPPRESHGCRPALLGPSSQSKIWRMHNFHSNYRRCQYRS